MKTHPYAKPFRNKGLVNYEMMGLLFGRSMAKGHLHHACTISPLGTDEECTLDKEMEGINLNTLLDGPP